MEICPTTALFKRRDGIVDFDGGRCIGCKACMQGCPYDALYIDPRTETAAKCNFCAHKVEVGLEPPCVTVCPTQAIVAGDLDEPGARIVQLLGREPTQVRKPEKGTRPKVFYIDGDAAALVPSAAPPASDYMWSSAAAAGDVGPAGRTRRRGPPAARTRSRSSIATPGAGRSRRTSGRSPWPPARSSSRPWPASSPDGPPAGVTVLTALGFLALTGVLLVWDLRQPQRFLWTLTRPQWRSWLTRGSYVIAAYGLLLTVHLRRGPPGRRAAPRLTAVTAGAGGGHGRSTRPSCSARPRAATCGSPRCSAHTCWSRPCTAGAALFDPAWLVYLLPLNGLLVAGEVWGHHPTEDGRRAARLIQEDVRFTTGVLAMGHLLPAGPALGAAPASSRWPRGLTLAGLLLWEHVYVQAPQRVPLA